MRTPVAYAKHDEAAKRQILARKRPLADVPGADARIAVHEPVAGCEWQRPQAAAQRLDGCLGVTTSVSSACPGRRSPQRPLNSSVASTPLADARRRAERAAERHAVEARPRDGDLVAPTGADDGVGHGAPATAGAALHLQPRPGRCGRDRPGQTGGDPGRAGGAGRAGDRRRRRGGGAGALTVVPTVVNEAQVS